MDEQKYEKGGSAGSKGSQFQVHLLAVFLLNALKMKLTNWRLSTEDKRAGKFDDVVLEWSEGAVLLQAKHKENKKRITVEQLMSTTSKNDDFSIPKYFISYQDIKDKFPLMKKAVICTNASVNERASTFLNSQTDSSDSILFCEGGTCSFYTLKDGILSELKDKIKTYYIHTGRDVDETLIADANMKDFQKHFQIYFDYPSGDDLQNVIERLLDRTSWRFKASASEIYLKVMNWFQQKNGNFLGELLLRAMVSEIRRDKYWQSLKQYDVQFSNNDLDFEDSNRMYHFIAESTYLLQEIRIWQALRGIGKKALYIHSDDSIEDQKQLIEAFRLENYIVLIIIQPSKFIVMEMWHQIKGILNKSAYKKLVLCTTGDNELIRLIQSDKNGFDVTKEPPTFEDILEDAQNRLLKSKKILFQANVITLEELFAPEPIRNYKSSLGSKILESLVGGEVIRVGSDVPVLEEEVERSYIPRNFIRKNEKRDEENIFEANDTLVLIAESPGMGKSTSLTKLGLLIKESNPHLWVVRIVLDHYSKFLKDSLLKQKTVIDIMEFLDSQEATRLTNQLDRLVFSRDKKVVLMLDGIDEISLKYTQLVESLLDNCLRSPNFIKIFATTRPHMVEKLEGKFQVKSFLMEPFSQTHQIEFLSKHWIHNLARSDREKCEQYAKALVSKMSTWTNPNFRWETDFAAIPLQIKMAAEIFQESDRNQRVEDWEGCREFLNADRLEPKLPEKIELARLYKLFMNKKLGMFIKKFNRCGSGVAEDALIKEYKDSLAFHRTLALTIIIDDEKIRNLFSCYKKGKNNCEAKLLKYGIIEEIDNGPRFVHRTFAEYFVAECLINELQSCHQNAEFQKFLIDDILVNVRFAVICNFFDGLLEDCVNALPRDTFQEYQCLSYDCDSFYPDRLCLVHELAEKGCLATIRLLLKCVDFKIIKHKETLFAELDKTIAKRNALFEPRYLGNRLTMLQLFVKEGGINIKDWRGRTPLYIASGRGHLEMVKFFIEQGANINTPGSGLQCTPLSEAAKRGHFDVVKLLVEQGTPIIGSVRLGGIELYEAISGKHVRIVKYLLEKIIKNASLESGLDAEYAMIPFAAAYLGRIDIFSFLVERGMDVDRRIINKQSLLFGAVMGGQFEAVKFLVEKGADINSRDNENNTVLHLVSENPSLTHIGKYFVDLGIHIDAKNNYKITALYIAASADTCDMAEFLIKRGADVNSTCTFGINSVMYRAALSNHLATVELLAQYGADFNFKNIHGNTLLHLFTDLGRLDVVKCLVKLGADVTIKDKDGRTALHVALLQHRDNIARYLFERDIDVDSGDNDGQTVLHLFLSMKVTNLEILFGLVDSHTYFHDIILQRLDIIKSLVSRGANINITNNEGQTILYLAILNVLDLGFFSCGRCLLVIKFLIKHGAVIDFESSKGDWMFSLAKEIQKKLQYRGQSLETILRLPVFRLLSCALPLNC